jgi:hypothetical protein
MPLRALPLLLLLTAVVPRAVHADAVVVTRAMKANTIMEAFVEERALVVELEIRREELDRFRTLVAATHGNLPVPPRAELSFIADGEILQGTIERVKQRRRVERDEVTGEPLPTPGNDEALFVVLRYPLSKRPKSLVLRPPLKNGYATTDIGFVLYHQGIAVNDFRYLSTAERVELHWDDPFYSRFDRKTLRRKLDSPMYVFLYVEPFEVRKEIVVRPLDLARLANLDIEPHRPIPPEQRDMVLAQIADFLAERSPVAIDGEHPEPILDRIHFLRRSLRMTRVVTPDEPIDATNAVVGAIFVYPVEGMPKEVRLRWNLFDQRIRRVPASATDEAGSMPSLLVPEDNELHWVNYLKGDALPGSLEVQAPRSRAAVPVGLGLGCVVALGALVAAWRRHSWLLGHAAVAIAVVAWLVPTPTLSVTLPSTVRTPSGEEAAPTLHALLYNVYRALDFRDEEVVFDRLAQSLSGDVLERVYLEMRTGLRLQNQGGARVRVRKVELLDVVPMQSTEPRTLRYRAKWNATGSVGHWGHTHLRTNQYEAEITLAPREDRWKIRDIAILEEQRVADAKQ